ncbi:cytochrome P450 78A3 [Polychaeton citri CBS 116435]|uniref:Cytochrome P450 78A3 n=1 Tax=Polychaeton citri CBS 116435 TaxID=1314669 RepID=A0A9P4UMI2_9PEZI|nr:cytochrome P450 78A3 [Polychaeton citri CBS 116435]
MLSRPSFLQFSGTAIIIGLLLERVLPQYLPSRYWNIVIVFAIEYTAWCLYSIVLYNNFFSPLRHLPLPPNSHWLTGQTKRILREPSGHPMRDWMATVPNDGLLRYVAWTRERVLITSPKNLGEVLVTKNYEFIKPSRFRAGLGRILGIGILFAEGEEHRVQRKNLMPAFAFRHVKDLYPVFWRKSQELMHCLQVAANSTASPSDELESSANNEISPEQTATDVPRHAPGVVEVDDWVSRATLDIIGVSGMGQDFNSLHDPQNKLSMTYKTIFNPSKVARYLQIAGIFMPFWIINRIPIKRNDDMNEAADFIKQTCRELIAQKRKQMEKFERTEVDILSVALESGGFRDEELVNQMMTFLVAGHETTATSMIWALYFLCRNSEVQRKLREEVRKNITSLESEVDSNVIDSCQYLHAVCAEVLRLRPPVSMTMREAACDTSIDGHFVPKGTTVVISPYAINGSPSLWGDDAAEFKPERWLDSSGRANKRGSADSNYSFLTFLHGPRGCIGQRFAEAEFACILAAWVGKFDTVFEDGSPLISGEPEIKRGVTAKPKGGLWVHLNEVEGW